MNRCELLMLVEKVLDRMVFENVAPTYRELALIILCTIRLLLAEKES